MAFSKKSKHRTQSFSRLSCGKDPADLCTNVISRHCNNSRSLASYILYFCCILLLQNRILRYIFNRGWKG